MIARRLHDDTEIEQAVANRRRLLRRRQQALPVAHEFDTEIEPHAVHRADQRKALPQRFEPRLQITADDTRILRQSFFGQDIEHGLADDRADGTAAGG
ncbi:hypothetical protein D9M70_493190 [compost metagenome]